MDYHRTMLRLGSIVVGADDVERAVAFWAAALGYRIHRFPDEPSDGFTILIPPSGEGTRVAVQRSETAHAERPRLHIDLIVDDDGEQAAEVARLLTLGATRPSWDYPDDPDFIVLADTEGNRFCVVNAGHH